jgi:hypothetical protein
MRYTNTRSGPEPDALNLAAGHKTEDHSANHDEDTSNEGAGRRSRWYRATPRRAGVLAVTAGIVLLAAACGGGSSSTGRTANAGGSSSTSGSSSTAAGSAGSGGSSNTGASTQAQQNLAFAQCMRSDGVTDFPDPGSNGQFPAISVQMEDQPRFGKGFNACKHLLPDDGVPKAQQDAPQLLKFAQCMHAHGVPSYPEPAGNVSPYSDLGPNTSVDLLKVAGLNPNSPVVSAAVQACERANPVGS